MIECFSFLHDVNLFVPSSSSLSGFSSSFISVVNIEMRFDCSLDTCFVNELCMTIVYKGHLPFIYLPKSKPITLFPPRS